MLTVTAILAAPFAVAGALMLLVVGRVAYRFHRENRR